jgi:quinol-cytochrome oxidoreductase complex cytochrome b subunit
LSYWAVTIGSNIAASARELTDLLGITRFFDIGGFLQGLLIGGDTVGQAALTRFFMLHVIFLPLALMVLTSVHFWRIRKDGGLSRPQSDSMDAKKKVYTWPLLMWIELAVFLSLIALLLFLAFFIDAPLLEKANPAHPENPAKSPWYFLGIQELVSYSAFAGGLLVPVLFLYFLFSIPFKDREDTHIGQWFSGREGRRIAGKAMLFSAGIVVLQVFILVKFGWLREWIPGISQWFILFINPATISVAAFSIYSVIVRKRTGSTRMAAISLFTLSIVALILFTIIGIWFRGANWEFGL